LFRTSIESGPSSARDSYAVTADGKAFLIDGRRADDVPPPITMMLNWMAGLTPEPRRALWVRPFGLLGLSQPAQSTARQ
jgi:hypothetical protein